MQSYNDEHARRIERMLAENQILADAVYQRQLRHSDPPLKRSWADAMPNWLVAIGLVSGLITSSTAVVLFLLDIGQKLSACH